MWLRPYFQPNGGLVVGLLLEERNFDPCAFPASVEDIRCGRAFRGGARKLNVELARISVLPCRLSALTGLNRLIPSSWGLCLFGASGTE